MSPHKEDATAGLPVPDSSDSFWLSEPSDFLLGHRTTPALPEYADVVIVGTGITGTSAARFLIEDERAEGMKVVVLEAREACWGATGRNGGHCQPLFLSRTADVARFELKNYDAVRSYVETHSIPCEWREAIGCCTYWSPELLAAAEDAVKNLQETHPDLGEKVKVITDKADLAEHRVQPGAAGATLSYWAGSLWPYKLVGWILEKLIREEKINLQTTTPVKSLEPISSGGEARWSVVTDRGAVAARNVILATNGYTSHLLPEFAELIVPFRGQMAALLPPKGAQRLPDTYGFVGAAGGDPYADDYLIQRPFEGVPNPKGHLMFGSGRTDSELGAVGEWDDGPVDRGSASYLRRLLLETLQLGGETDGLKELEATHQWTGIMGYSRDNHPWVGGLPDTKGIWLSAGYAGHGMPNGYLCGKAVADMLLADQAGSDVEIVVEEMVESGNLPRAYLITEERIARAKQHPTVAVQHAVRRAAWKQKGGAGKWKDRPLVRAAPLQASFP